MTSGTGGVPRFELAPGYSVPRAIVGLWQLSAGHARSALDLDRVLAMA